MKNRIGSCTLGVTLLLASLSASADHNIWLGVRAGTLGLGAEATWAPLPWIDVRAGITRFSYDDTGAQAGVNYEGELSLDNVYGTANFRFPLSPMRFTAGFYSNGNELMLASRDNVAIQVGDTLYPAAAVGTLTSVTSFESGAPYAGIGFDFDLFDKVGMNLDLGVLWQGDPNVTLESDGLLANDALFRAELEDERQQLLAEMEDFKAWPVAALGFTYKFF